MAMKLIWADEAIESVDDTADYIEENFGVARSIEFYDEVQSRADELEKHPKLGPIDEDLMGGQYEYRSLGIGELSSVI